MGIDPGPDLPPLASARGAGRLKQEREVTVEGRQFRAGPQPGSATPYYYPGGMVQGRQVPQGWYSQPLWKSALASGAGALGGLLIFDALFDGGGFGGGFGGGGFDQGFADGYQDGYQDAGQDQGSDGGNDGGNDFGGFDGVGGGDFGGGDFGGGDF
jgi:hypothetical protein